MIIFQAERHFPFTRHQSMWSPCLSGKLLFFHKILSNTNIKNIIFPSIPVLEFSFFLLCLKLDCTHFYISKEIASVSCWPFPFSPSWHWILLSCWTHAAHIKALPDSPFSLFYITYTLFYLLSASFSLPVLYCKDWLCLHSWRMAPYFISFAFFHLYFNTSQNSIASSYISCKMMLYNWHSFFG